MSTFDQADCYVALLLSRKFYMVVIFPNKNVFKTKYIWFREAGAYNKF